MTSEQKIARVIAIKIRAVSAERNRDVYMVWGDVLEEVLKELSCEQIISKATYVEIEKVKRIIPYVEHIMKKEILDKYLWMDQDRLDFIINYLMKRGDIREFNITTEDGEIYDTGYRKLHPMRSKK